jgi:hypothetical protein
VSFFKQFSGRGLPAVSFLVQLEYTMSDNKFLIFCMTICSCVAFGYGFDTDGYYLRQALLVLAGYTIAGVLFLIFTESE